MYEIYARGIENSETLVYHNYEKVVDEIMDKERQHQEFDIEVQRADKGADRKRARYHSSIMDSHLLAPNEDFSKLPETYVIFITENDVIGANEPIYFIDRQITNIGRAFDDGEHIIYVNGENKNAETALGKLMHDFFCTNPKDMYYKELAKKVDYLKNTEEGVRTLCKVMEDMRNETAENMKIEIAQRLISQGKLAVEDIASAAALTVEKVRELAGEKKLLV